MKELKTRKNIRLKEYNYANKGYYFITICTQNRVEILGKVNVGGAVLGAPDTQKYIELTKEGEIAKKHLEICNNKIKNVKIDEYIINNSINWEKDIYY